MLIDEYNNFITEHDSEIVDGTALLNWENLIVRIHLPNFTDKLHIFAALGFMNDNNKTEVLNWLASVNLMGTQTNGGYVGLHEESGIILFSQWTNLSAKTADELEKDIEAFVNTHCYLVNEFTKIGGTLSSSDKTSVDDFMNNSSDLFINPNIFV